MNSPECRQQNEEVLLPSECLQTLQAYSSCGGKFGARGLIGQDRGYIIVDTGSPVSLLGSDYLDELLEAATPSVRSTVQMLLHNQGDVPTRVVNFGGVKPVRTQGTISLYMRIGTVLAQVEFLVVPGPVPAILGRLDMSALGMVIDPDIEEPGSRGPEEDLK